MIPVSNALPGLLTGARVQLVPVGEEHYEYLRRAEIERLGVWWRTRGVMQSPEEFARRAWAGILHQFVAIGVEDGKPLVWLQCYNADPVNGSAAVSIARLDDRGLSLRTASAIARFFEYCFITGAFRKLYLEVAAPNLPLFASTLGPLFVEEGRLVDHIQMMDGGFCDLHVLSLWRFTWEASHSLRGALLERG